MEAQAAHEASHVVPVNPPPALGLAAKLRKKRSEQAGAESQTEGQRKANQTTVPVRTPDRQWWIRAHRDPQMQVPVDILVITGGEHEGTWFLDPEVEFPPELDQYVKPAILTRCITHDGTEFFYLSKQSAKSPKESIRRCIQAAREGWIQVRWNPTSKGYEFERARRLKREPAWSNDTLDELLEKAFGDRYVDRRDHPTINRLLFPDDDDFAGEPAEAEEGRQ